jgi:hypothetical protein
VTPEDRALAAVEGILSAELDALRLIEELLDEMGAANAAGDKALAKQIGDAAGLLAYETGLTLWGMQAPS